MVNGNRKGKAAEREWSGRLTAAGFPARRGQQYQGGHDSADIICPLLDPILHPEVKRVEKMALYDWIEQAQADASPGQMAYVAHRKNKKPWLVTMPGEHFLELMQLLKGVL